MAVFTDEIQLKDSVSAAAKAAQLQVKTLESSLASAQKALVKTEALGDKAGFGKAQEQVKKYSEALAGLSPEVKALAGQDNAARMNIFNGAAKQNGEALKKSQDEARAFGEAFDKGVSKALEIGIFALKVAATAIVGFATATAGAILLLAKFTIGASESKQEMLTLFDAMGAGVTSGAELEASIDKLKDKFGISKDSLVGWANQLEAMGVVALPDLERSLLAVASAAALVKGGDAAYLSLAKKIQLAAESGHGLKIPLKGLGSLVEMGIRVDDVAKQMGVSSAKLTDELKAGSVDAKKFGLALDEALTKKGEKPLARLAASSENISKLLKESIGDIFEDVDVGPFLAQVKRLFDIFSQGTESGKALKGGLGGGMQFIFDRATELLPVVKRLFLQLAIYALQAYIAIKPIPEQLKAFADSQQGVVVLQTLENVLRATAIAGGIVVASIALVVAVLGVAGAQIAVFLLAVETAKQKLIEWAMGGESLGAQLMGGLVNGILFGAPELIKTITGVIGSTIGAAESVLKIGSPSKVFAEIGQFSTQGMAQGLEAGSSEVQGAASSVAGMAVTGAVQGSQEAPAQAAPAGGPVQIFVQIEGAGKSALEITEEMIAIVWERMASRQGAGATT